jgi:3-oxoacyl-[acyl-carrier protein] reductase
MPGRLTGKVAIVTGAGLGLGEGITKKFIEEGAKVLMMDINTANGEKVAAAQPAGTAVFVKGDVSVQEDWKKAVDATVSHFGQIDIVVNNAGVIYKNTVQ